MAAKLDAQDRADAANTDFRTCTRNLTESRSTLSAFATTEHVSSCMDDRVQNVHRPIEDIIRDLQRPALQPGIFKLEKTMALLNEAERAYQGL